MDEGNLRRYIDKFFDDLVLYDDYKNGHYYKDLLKAGIDVFLDNENSYNAFEVYRTFLMVYQITAEDKSESNNDVIKLEKQPNILLDLVKTMREYEKNTGDLIDKQRDHFIHSVNVFLLGLAIYAQNSKYREYFKAYILRSHYTKYYKLENGDFSNEEFLYRWGVAALFHDIGYPVEIIGKQLKKFINDGVKSISHTYGADTAIDFKDFNEFNTIVKIDPNFADEFTKNYPEAKFLNLFKPTDIIAHKISTDFDSVNVNEVVKHLDNFVYAMGEMGFIDHGFFSCILVLNSYGYLIQKYSKSHEFFFYPIVDSATAILLHNYYRNVLQKNPFNLKELHPSQSPLAFLLILCDELQEWNRTPFGIKDKQRGHVNELLLKIDDESFDIKYIAKNGTMGLGFSEDKVKLLYNVLSLNSVFQFGLRIITDVQQHFTPAEMNHENSQSPDILLRNVERLAILIHEKYNETIKRQYEEAVKNGTVDDELQEKYDDIKPFDELSPQLKIANIRQAQSIPIKLDIIGCEIADRNDEREEIIEFSDEEVEDLAIFEHDEWCREKEGTGWVYGEKKDIKNLVTPYLISWDELTEEIREYDRDPVRNIPSLMKSIDLKVVRTKIRLLTFEIHDFYQNDVSFEDLPDYVKYTNYKQVDYLIKILGLRGYSVVDDDAPGEAIFAFDPDTIEYFAEREHEAWYKLKVNLGWTYGSIKDEMSKTNPNLVSWGALSFENKEANRNTFKNLPRMCSDVGLKIVKN